MAAFTSRHPYLTLFLQLAVPGDVSLLDHPHAKCTHLLPRHVVDIAKQIPGAAFGVPASTLTAVITRPHQGLASAVDELGTEVSPPRRSCGAVGLGVVAHSSSSGVRGSPGRPRWSHSPQ